MNTGVSGDDQDVSGDDQDVSGDDHQRSVRRGPCKGISQLTFPLLLIFKFFSRTNSCRRL